MTVLALLVIVAGSVVGVLAVVRPPQLRKKIAIGLGVYLLLAISAGLYAAMQKVASPHGTSSAAMLAKGIAETMNCGAYGFVAGVIASAVVAASRRLLRR